MLIIEKLVRYIDHPASHLIPYLRWEPQPWPKEFSGPWNWTGGLSNGRPIFRWEGKATPVHRILYHMLLSPPEGDHRINPLTLLNVNPLSCEVQMITRQTAEPPERMSFEEICDWLDDVCPTNRAQLEQFSAIPPNTLYRALVHTNLINRLNITEEDLINAYASGNF